MYNKDTYRDLNTPMIILDVAKLEANRNDIYKICVKTGVKSLYSVKANSLIETINIIGNKFTGLAVSSLFEATLARELLGVSGNIHYTTPGIRKDEIDYLCEFCDYIAFNSLNQWKRYKLKVLNRTSPGLRINPQISYVEDERFNPSAKHSKLGVPLDQLTDVLEGKPYILEGLEGIHFHNNSESTDFTPLLETVLRLDETISPLLNQVNWINLGGGYYFGERMDYGPFEEAIDLLKTKYNLDVIIEPGAAIVQEAGNLVSEVIDMFDSDGKTIAVLDTTVNHLPEVLEFQYQPDVMNSSKDGQFEYILAGASCLAGDKFGTYCFNTPLEIGNRVVFTGVGAYSLVKAHMFNGINLPSVYCEREDGKIELIKQYQYEDFLNRCGAVISERLRKRA